MKKVLILFVMIMFFLTLCVSEGFSMSTGDVLKKMVEAQGGKKVLANIKDSSFSGTMELIPMSANGSISIYWRSPNKRRSDIEIMGMKIIQAYDGKTAWMDNPQAGGVQEMPEKFAKAIIRQSMGYDTLFNAKKYGLTFTLKGKEKVNDTEYIVLEQAFSDGYKMAFYVDPETYLVYKTKGKTFGPTGAEVESEIFPSDYKEVGGMMIPHALKIFQEGREFMKMTFDKVSFNSGVDDSFFKMPK
jgi:outer membrane lipoprotein-sorting protein